MNAKHEKYRQSIIVSSPALYITTILVWGSTWMAIEFQLGTVAPEVSIAYRYALASLLLFGWCVVRGLRLRFDEARDDRMAD